jgi:TonB family protein
LENKMKIVHSTAAHLAVLAVLPLAFHTVRVVYPRHYSPAVVLVAPQPAPVPVKPVVKPVIVRGTGKLAQHEQIVSVKAEPIRIGARHASPVVAEVAPAFDAVLPESQVIGLPTGSGTSVVGTKIGIFSQPAALPKLVRADFALAQARRTAVISTSPVVVSRAPARYTDEARARNIQGEVTYRVRFTATGKIEVLGLVHGLGYGLDENALDVINSIRFTPATTGGQAIDFVTVARVTFALSQ